MSSNPKSAKQQTKSSNKKTLALILLILGLVLGIGQAAITTKSGYGEIYDFRETTGMYVECDPGEFHGLCGTCQDNVGAKDWDKFCEWSMARIEYGWPLRSAQLVSVPVLANFLLFSVPLALPYAWLAMSERDARYKRPGR